MSSLPSSAKTNRPIYMLNMVHTSIYNETTVEEGFGRKNERNLLTL